MMVDRNMDVPEDGAEENEITLSDMMFADSKKPGGKLGFLHTNRQL